MTSITCVLAFLLTILDSENPRSRLVLVGNEITHNYRTYNIPQNQYFPKPKDKSILMAPHKISEKDTLLTSYCSRNFNMISIMNDIASGLTEMTHPSSLELIKKADIYTDCLEKIRSWWDDSIASELDPIPFISMKSIYYLTKCTASQIMRLASERFVQVHGEFRCFVPYTYEDKPIINAEKHIKLEVEVWKRQAFYGMYEMRHQYALAWFHGHLHVFKRARGIDHVWYLETTLDDVKGNGIKIYDFMLKNYSAFENFTLMLEKRREKIFQKSSSGKPRMFKEFLQKISEKKVNKYLHNGLDMTHISGELHCPV
ncbi:BgTH12-02151 [Blumeria graminis f. sp. triticale]|uniref:BgTH12-02151 n=1 Tax=Blumeria graminis f. sp. triticale TaxID=1689686 RepID=A0A9W4GEL7_BLUGR|nr:BgTH12-02151 [Blumeria graminis f. sp. triticale]